MTTFTIITLSVLLAVFVIWCRLLRVKNKRLLRDLSRAQESLAYSHKTAARLRRELKVYDPQNVHVLAGSDNPQERLHGMLGVAAEDVIPFLNTPLHAWNQMYEARKPK